ncbi:MAG: alpha/beta hydrolase [Candidatus Binatia bacterium]|nr:alpha/beta hydrolase [Candidatus Binatia bacterium]
MKGSTPQENHKLLNGRTSLHLSHLREGTGTPLLLLHELFTSSDRWSEQEILWEGPVWALDFGGHGSSDWRAGGAYYPELFATDVDSALEEIGPTCVAGAGLGAYVALLVAGARTEKIPGALLFPGAGLIGGGDEPSCEPDASKLDELEQAHADTNTPEEIATDPRVVLAQDDIRPPDYAASFGARSQALLLAEDGKTRPGWWEVLRELPKVHETSIDRAKAFEALSRFR